MISDNKKWYFSSGLEFGLISSSTASIVDTGEAIDLESQTSDYSLSINFGVNYLLSLGKPFLTIGVRYNQGLVNLTNSEDSGSYVPRIKSSGIQFLLGFQYPVNKGE